MNGQKLLPVPQVQAQAVLVGGEAHFVSVPVLLLTRMYVLPDSVGQIHAGCALEQAHNLRCQRPSTLDLCPFRLSFLCSSLSLCTDQVRLALG